MSGDSEPLLFCEWRTVEVFHVLKTNDVISDYWYTVSAIGDEEYEFDVRDLPSPEGVTDHTHRLVIQSALDAGLIELPEEVSPGDADDTPWAMCATADGADTICVDARPFLRLAPEAMLFALAGNDWREQGETCQILHWLDAYDYKVPGLLSRNPGAEFVCYIGKDDAMNFLAHERSDLYWRIRVRAGTAVAVEGTVTETLVATKTVSTFAPITEDGQCDAEAAIRKAAYQNSLQDFAHGWDLDCENCDVTASESDTGNIADTISLEPGPSDHRVVIVVDDREVKLAAWGDELTARIACDRLTDAGERAILCPPKEAYA